MRADTSNSSGQSVTEIRIDLSTYLSVFTDYPGSLGEQTWGF